MSDDHGFPDSNGAPPDIAGSQPDSPAVGPALAAGTALVAAGYKTQFPIADAVVMEAAPEESVGADIGAARAVFLGASALGPGVVGLVAELTTFAGAFWLLVASFLLCAAVLARQYRR